MECEICNKDKPLSKISGHAICKECNRKLEEDTAKMFLGGRVPAAMQAEWDKTWAENRIRESETKSQPKAKSDGCFPSGTAVATPFGDIDISLVREGDSVLAFDAAANSLRARKVISTRKYETNNIWKIQFTDGSCVRTTDHHRFRVGGAWVKACEIVCGNLVSSIGPFGSLATRRVERSLATDEVQDVFNLIVEGDFSFLADGVVASSFSRFMNVQALGWTIYAAIRNFANRAGLLPIPEGVR